MKAQRLKSLHMQSVTEKYATFFFLSLEGSGINIVASNPHDYAGKGAF